MQGTVAVLDFMRMNRKILILFISLAPLSGGEEILQAVVVHMTLYTKKNLVRSVKNQVSRRVGVVEDSGAEVKHRRKGEEGLEGSQPLDKVTCSYGANYGSHCPDAVRHPVQRSSVFRSNILYITEVPGLTAGTQTQGGGHDNCCNQWCLGKS